MPLRSKNPTGGEIVVHVVAGVQTADLDPVLGGGSVDNVVVSDVKAHMGGVLSVGGEKHQFALL